jgi:hypothetical protein
MWTVNELKLSVIRSVSLYTRGLLTLQETGAGLFADFAFTLHKQAEERRLIAELLEIIPKRLILAMGEQLSKRRLPDGGWQWPPEGAIGTMPEGKICIPTVFGPADASGVSMYETLSVLLHNPIDVRSSQNT